MAEKRSAGLPLSVGSASLPVRIVIAGVFLMVSATLIAAGIHTGGTGPLAAAFVAAVAIVPLGMVAAVAAAFVLAPLSRFGRWLDTFLPTLAGIRGWALVVALWSLSGAAIFVVRLV